MTKTEQLRVTTWRSKVLQHATTIGNVSRTRRRVGRHPARSDRGRRAREPPARGAADYRVQAEARAQAAWYV